jgi:hypothetical protein
LGKKSKSKATPPNIPPSCSSWNFFVEDFVEQVAIA